MKKLLLLGMLLVSLGVNAQTYSMKIFFQRGDSVSYPVSDISRVVMEEFQASEDENHEEDVQTLVDNASGFLFGDIVLSTKTTMSGVDKTLLSSGCPMKFKFEWSQTDNQAFTITLLDFTAAGMTLNFKCDVKCMTLNSWEKQEYTGDGWIKFNGQNGSVSSTDDTFSGTHGSIQGYYNVNTHQIEFIVNYNIMNLRTECFLQVIDKDRINHYDEEKAQYEKDLAEYKKENGIK